MKNSTELLAGSSISYQKNKNILKTALIFSLFLVFVIGLGFIFSQIYANSSILYFTVIFSILMNIVSYWYSDKIVLAMAKAKPIEEKDYPEIYEIVRRLAKSANLEMPKIYLIDENQINAFATGRNSKHAAVAVTRGALEKLNKKELEGVLSHELSHVSNRDILVSTVVVILVGFISILSDLFLRSAFWGGFNRRNREENNQAGTILMIVGMILAILAPIAALLIQLAISRKRESLADFSGAMLTKNANGLADALEKISRDEMPLRVANNSTSHLWIDNPFKGKSKTFFLQRLFLTHPPIEERIKALRNLKILHLTK